jgi:oxepin-CoA hydrolase/3-oxo-5,6-dehydrosuberyl-CoA semialdehyde dehydrogenase
VSGSIGDLLSTLTPGCGVVHRIGLNREKIARTRDRENAVRVNVEADSLNCILLGPDVAPGSPTFEHFKNEVVSEMTVKAGQKCTPSGAF